MGWIGSIIIGGLAGWIASMITKNDHQMGIFLNIIAGIVGGVLGSWLMRQFGIYTGDGWLPSLLSGIVGAVIILAIINLFTRKRVR